MWRGQGRSFDRSADATSGGYEQWSQQARGDPSAELSARYAVPAGVGAPAATATTAPAVMPPGFAYTPAPFVWDVGATMGGSGPSTRVEMRVWRSMRQRACVRRRRSR